MSSVALVPDSTELAKNSWSRQIHDFAFWWRDILETSNEKNPKSYFWNIVLEDGAETDVELFPPTADTACP